jgi:hypothetical protein
VGSHGDKKRQEHSQGEMGGGRSRLLSKTKANWMEPLILNGDWRRLNTGPEACACRWQWEAASPVRGRSRGYCASQIWALMTPISTWVNGRPAHIGAVNDGPWANTCLWIRRWATVNAREYDGPSLALINLSFIIHQGYIESGLKGRVMWVFQGNFEAYWALRSAVL